MEVAHIIVNVGDAAAANKLLTFGKTTAAFFTRFSPFLKPLRFSLTKK